MRRGQSILLQGILITALLTGSIYLIRIDFSLFLVVLTLLCGLFWLAGLILRFANRRGTLQHSEVPRPEGTFLFGLVYSLRSLFPVLLLVLLLRSFVFEPFRIPSASMMPGLQIGDFIAVNKYAYGLRLPVLNSKIVELGNPERGDVVVFRYPHPPFVPYIKRVVGLPGDHVVYLGKQLFINGNAVPQTLQTEPYHEQQGAGKVVNGYKVHKEMLTEAGYNILHDEQRDEGGLVEAYVPKAHYFVLGDNRDHSRDSRYWGFVPERNLIGKAVLVWMHWDWEKRGFFNFSRIGTKITPAP